jgi:superfamily II DNA or RNA helicase
MTKAKLYQWQEEALDLFAKAEFFALVADCGLGKTRAAIEIARRKSLPCLIITPGAALCGQWKEEILASDPDADVWVYNRQDEARLGEAYRDKLREWLASAAGVDENSDGGYAV